MTPKPKILFVLTSQSTFANSDHPTGWYLPEFAHPYHILQNDAQIVVASPKGGAAPLDPASVEPFIDDEISQKFLKTKESLWNNTEKLSDFLGKAQEFEAIFFVGGHGPMFDLATDETSHKIINEFFENQKIIAAVCHGPAALAHVKLSSGRYLLDGYAVTGFTNAEEEAVQLTSSMPFHLETQLDKASGGKFQKANELWGKHVVISRHGLLITGQNPASATAVGDAIHGEIFGKQNDYRG